MVVEEQLAATDPAKAKGVGAMRCLKPCEAREASRLTPSKRRVLKGGGFCEIN